MMSQFYWATKKIWIRKKTIFDKKSSIYLLPRLRVQDIDNLDDWRIAEKLYKLENEKKIQFKRFLQLEKRR